MADENEHAHSLETHRKFLQRYALFHLRDSSLAEDAVQDTLMAALARRTQFQGRSQLRTWLTVILRNKIIDLTRSRGRGLPANTVALGEDTDSDDGSFKANGEWIDPPADWGRPDAALESNQFWRVYKECCQRLTERDALVFSMREVEGLSSDEICRTMSMSTTNLHVILFRARQRLRSCMNDKWFAGKA